MFLYPLTFAGVDGTGDGQINDSELQSRNNPYVRTMDMPNNSTTILPSVVERTTVKREDTASNLVSDDYSICTLLAVVAFVGTREGIPGKE
jgi:hypothetical protein